MRISSIISSVIHQVKMQIISGKHCITYSLTPYESTSRSLTNPSSHHPPSRRCCCSEEQQPHRPCHHRLDHRKRRQHQHRRMGQRHRPQRRRGLPPRQVRDQVRHPHILQVVPLPLWLQQPRQLHLVEAQSGLQRQLLLRLRLHLRRVPGNKLRESNGNSCHVTTSTHE